MGFSRIIGPSIECQETRTGKLGCLHTRNSWHLCYLKPPSNVPPPRTKTEGPFRSNLEPQAEHQKTEEKLHQQWPPIKATQRDVDRTWGLYQHGQQPKAGPSSSSWPPPTVTNLWDLFGPNASKMRNGNKTQPSSQPCSLPQLSRSSWRFRRKLLPLPLPNRPNL